MSTNNKPEKPSLGKLQHTVSIDKQLIPWVLQQVDKTKSPSVNRWVNDVLRRLWAGSDR